MELNFKLENTEKNVVRDKYIYIMLTATTTKIAQCVRFITKAEYSHASISFDENMERLYSFGRFHHCMPFIGGFIRETVDRIGLKRPHKVKIKILRIPVSSEEYQAGLERIREISEDSEYTYNLRSAVTFMRAHGIADYKAYTCSEFTAHLLRTVRPDLLEGIEDCKVVPEYFSKHFTDYEYYCGRLVDYKNFVQETNAEYFKKINFFKRHYKTAKYVRYRYGKKFLKLHNS